jgi:hypothetical protein
MAAGSWRMAEGKGHGAWGRGPERRRAEAQRTRESGLLNFRKLSALCVSAVNLSDAMRYALCAMPPSSGQLADGRGPGAESRDKDTWQ